MKTLQEISKVRNATISRVVTEILADGWEKTGWSGKSATTKTDRRGLKRKAKQLRDRQIRQIKSGFRFVAPKGMLP